MSVSRTSKSERAWRLGAVRIAADEERELLVAAKSGCRRSVEKLLAANEDLVQFQVSRFRSFRHLSEDLASAGRIGVLEAIKRFDTTVQTRLGTYAVHYVRAYIYSVLRKNRSAVSTPGTRVAVAMRSKAGKAFLTQLALENEGKWPVDKVAEHFQTTATEIHAIINVLYAPPLSVMEGDDCLREDWNRTARGIVAHSTVQDAESAVAERQEHALLRGVLASMNPRTRRVLEARFWEGMTLGEVGLELGVTRERVRQIELSGIRHLRRRMDAVGIARGSAAADGEKQFISLFAVDRKRKLSAARRTGCGSSDVGSSCHGRRMNQHGEAQQQDASREVVGGAQRGGKEVEGCSRD